MSENSVTDNQVRDVFYVLRVESPEELPLNLQASEYPIYKWVFLDPSRKKKARFDSYPEAGEFIKTQPSGEYKIERFTKVP